MKWRKKIIWRITDEENTKRHGVHDCYYIWFLVFSRFVYRVATGTPLRENRYMLKCQLPRLLLAVTMIHYVLVKIVSAALWVLSPFFN